MAAAMAMAMQMAQVRVMGLAVIAWPSGASNQARDRWVVLLPRRAPRVGCAGTATAVVPGVAAVKAVEATVAAAVAVVMAEAVMAEVTAAEGFVPEPFHQKATGAEATAVKRRI